MGIVHNPGLQLGSCSNSNIGFLLEWTYSGSSQCLFLAIYGIYIWR
jgi:hypothetical protein